MVRQSFFDNNPRNFIPLGSGVLGCRGFNSSFRTTQGGLFLNMGKFLHCNFCPSHHFLQLIVHLFPS